MPIPVWRGAEVRTKSATEMALICESSLNSCLSWTDAGREQEACSVQSHPDAICVGRQADESKKTASESLPGYTEKRRNRADFKVRLRHEIGKRSSLMTAGQTRFGRNLVGRPKSELASIYTIVGLQPARRSEDVYSPRNQSVFSQLDI